MVADNADSFRHNRCICHCSPSQGVGTRAGIGEGEGKVWCYMPAGKRDAHPRICHDLHFGSFWGFRTEHGEGKRRVNDDAKLREREKNTTTNHSYSDHYSWLCDATCSMLFRSLGSYYPNFAAVTLGSHFDKRREANFSDYVSANSATA